MGDTSIPPKVIQMPNLTELAPGIQLLNPLSRKGTGPGLILLVDKSLGLAIENGVPSPLIKWGEEGYTVVEIEQSAFSDDNTDVLGIALDGLSSYEKCSPKDASIGLIAYKIALFELVKPLLSLSPSIVGAVIYGEAADEQLTHSVIPVLQHVFGASKLKATRTEALIIYKYATAAAATFATPFHKDFHYANEAVSHARNLTFLKKLMNGPYFDLEAIWDEHTYYEFENRSVPHTMATMVQEPYVNHVPTMTGGIGREKLSDFYSNHFVWNNPEDTELELISRTVGIDRVIDEFIYKFTHTTMIDWLLPGIPPSGLKVEIPFTAVVNIRGDRLYHEHIAWDQATALRQVGLLPEYLPYDRALPDGTLPKEGKRFEYRVPAAGVETAKKMKDKNSVVSNGMFEYGIREVDT
ncbi:hypothetical protein BJ878DRAFT_317502 [Calycina marina]|uniref:Carboxymethylenebutenolidase n=1 Tax=Calycina marina TaxID=1763456 RepID=A0A9P7Z6U9_9HELO|nr:hypothetical protein BJ878DRAFT_317502 [Calycina marina]